VNDLARLRTPRPHRADAGRNFDAILAAARTAFTELGADAPLDEIARRAGVGIATLYRNFPTREQLIENVYITEVEAVAQAAVDGASLDPWGGLTRWLRRYVDYVGAKRALITGLNRDSATFQACRDELFAAGSPLLERAQRDGAVRPDVTIVDVMWLVSGVAGVGGDPDRREKVLAVALDGLRFTGGDKP
jgi:AcrR family transcriptional regulator